LSVNDFPWDSSLTSVPDAVCRSLLLFQDKQVMVSTTVPRLAFATNTFGQ
jgi:hypothetical protein